MNHEILGLIDLHQFKKLLKVALEAETKHGRDQKPAFLIWSSFYNTGIYPKI
jgi:hypothetical protein